MNIIELYKTVNKYVDENYNFLGLNRKREISRLIFEILKIGKISDLSLLPPYKNWHQFKRSLLRIRYPLSYEKYPLDSFFLPKIELNENYLWKDENSNEIEIFVEKDANADYIVENIKKGRKAKVVYIDLFKEHIKNLKKTEFNYNMRKKKIYIVKERYDFLKKCPCTRGCISCSYWILNINFGCTMDCEYCYLCGYQNIDGLIINSNISDYLKNVDNSSIGKFSRIGSGEFTDSLLWDNITGNSQKLIEFFSKRNLIFEFKTKTDNIDNILNMKSVDNVVISYSMNPSKIIDEFEHNTLEYNKRIECMIKLVKKGWKVGIHFDPIIYVNDYEKLYRECLRDIFSNIPKDRIAWISAGTLRFHPDTKRRIEMRFPNSKLLDCEMIIDFDGKLRYPYEIRKGMYQIIVDFLNENNFDMKKFYLCMEEFKMWRDLKIWPYFKW